MLCPSLKAHNTRHAYPWWHRSVTGEVPRISPVSTSLKRCDALPSKLTAILFTGLQGFRLFHKPQGVSRKEEAKSATTPTHHYSSIVSPYQLQPASPQQKYVTNDLNRTTATVHTILHTSFSYLSDIHITNTGYWDSFNGVCPIMSWHFNSTRFTT